MESLEDRTLPTVSWINPAGGDWETASNWSTGAVPDATADVVINLPGITVTHSSAVADAVNSLISQDAIFLSGGSLSIAANSSINAAFTLSGEATLTGTGNLTISGLFTWQGSTVSTSGTVTAQGGIEANGGSILDFGTLVNQGVMHWNGGNLSLSNGSHLDNQGTFAFQVGGGLHYGGGAFPVFTNEGSVLESPVIGFRADIDITFINTGVMHLQNGQLFLGNTDISGPTSSTTTDLVADVGTNLVLVGDWQIWGNVRGGDVNFQSGDLTVYGSVSVDGAAFNVSNVIFEGAYQASTTTFRGYAAGDPGGFGHVIMNGPVVALGSVDVFSNAHLTLAPATRQTLTLPSLYLGGDSTIDGPDNLVVQGLFTWQQGALSTTGTTTAQGGILVIQQPGPFTSSLNSGTLVNQGVTNWTSGNVFVTNGGSFINSVTGTFDDQTDGTFGGPECPTFTNQGLFIKSGGTGTTNLEMDFFNSGIVEVQSGILNVSCGYVQTAGSTVASGGSLTGSVSIQGGNIQGSIPADVSNTGQQTVVPSPNPTTIANYTQTATGTLNEQIGGLAAGTQYGQIIVNGNVNLAGTLHVALINGFLPQNGNQFTIIDNRGSNPISGTFNGLPEGATILDTTGKYSFTVSYVGGDGNNLVLTAKQVATTTAVAASVNQSILNQAVTFTATVTPTAGNGTPTGSVQFQIDNVNVGSPVTLSGGSASLNTATLAVGTHTISAVYSGDGNYFGSTGSLSENVHYTFSGFLPPLNKKVSFALNRTIPIKFRLSDFNGTAITDLSAVSSLQVIATDSSGNPLSGAQPFNPASSNNKGLHHRSNDDRDDDGEKVDSTYIFNWKTKGLSAGYYKILLTLADGTVQTRTLQLTVKKGDADLMAASSGSGDNSGSGALLAGNLNLYVDNTSGLFTADELARIDDAVAAVDATVASYGVIITETTDSTAANVVLDTGSTSASGGFADGVLGCTTDAGEITLIHGWNWFAGSDPAAVGSGQFDFETVVLHELGHALGLGHSSDATSVMYATLATGVAQRSLKVADLAIPDGDVGAHGLHAAPVRDQGEGMAPTAAIRQSSDFRALALGVGNGNSAQFRLADSAPQATPVADRASGNDLRRFEVNVGRIENPSYGLPATMVEEMRQDAAFDQVFVEFDQKAVTEDHLRTRVLPAESPKPSSEDGTPPAAIPAGNDEYASVESLAIVPPADESGMALRYQACDACFADEDWTPRSERMIAGSLLAVALAANPQAIKEKKRLACR